MHQESKLFSKKNVSLICASLVPLLVTGPFLPDFLVSVMSVCFLYYSWKHKLFYIYKNFYFYTFILFYLVCILSSLLSENIFFSLKSSMTYIRIGVFALLISYLIDEYKKILDYFYYSLVITFSVLILDGYFQYFNGVNLFGFKVIGVRISSLFGDELILGSFLARLYPLLFALFIIRSNVSFFEKFIISILFLLIDVLIFLTGERASFFLFNLSTLFIILFISKYKWTRIAIFFTSSVIIIFIILNNNSLYDRYIKSPMQGMGLDQQNAKKKIFTPSHDFLINTAWNMFLDKPILGHGPKTFRIVCNNEKYKYNQNFNCENHPHNFYIQLLAETGIIGFSFLAGLFVYFIYLSIRHIVEYFKYRQIYLSNYQICLLGGLLITIWPITSNGDIFTNNLMLFYSLQMGFFKKNI
jgi:O-antigen ligase